VRSRACTQAHTCARVCKFHSSGHNVRASFTRVGSHARVCTSMRAHASTHMEHCSPPHMQAKKSFWCSLDHNIFVPFGYGRKLWLLRCSAGWREGNQGKGAEVADVNRTASLAPGLQPLLQLQPSANILQKQLSPLQVMSWQRRDLEFFNNTSPARTSSWQIPAHPRSSSVDCQVSLPAHHLSPRSLVVLQSIHTPLPRPV
jgi:hypothetical protein